MFQTQTTAIAGKAEFYRELHQQLGGLLNGEIAPIANAANTCVLLYQLVPELNWVGFYFCRRDELVLGSFQGKPACVRIPFGKGVCGTAVAEARSILVPDVHSFPGHITCDAASRSELVVPLRRGSTITGVLDLDSPVRGRFDADDQAAMERVAALYVAAG